MGTQRGDNRWGGGDDERWQGNRYEREGGSFGNWGSNRDRGDWDRGREQGGYGGQSGGNDRGFFERAGEQVRSWFGDDDDRSGRGGNWGGGGRDENVRWQSSRGFEGGGDPVHWNRGEHRGNEGGGGFSGGGRGGDWNRDQDRMRSSGGGGGGGGYARDYQSSGGGGGGGADTWGGSGFGGLDDNGRRFDRIDAGSTGTQGAHPMSAPVSGGYGTSAGIGASGGFGGGGSSARSAAIMRQAGQQHGQSGGFGGGQSHHDPHYSEWRQRQIHDLDRDYDEYRREHQSKFEQEFGGWRQKRQTQRQHMGRVTEHMTVVGSDGEHIGTVDAVKGDRIVLTKNDEAAGGRHHSIPCSWIESVDDKVTVNKTADEAKRAWKDEENNRGESRALFERDDQGSEGPHMLNRSFSGTYDDNK
jgi:hypothetical protein